MTDEYEVRDVLEVGGAAALIRDKVGDIDEFIGPGGPDPEYVDNDYIEDVAQRFDSELYPTSTRWSILVARA